jgi:hypothetical protein
VARAGWEEVAIELGFGREAVPHLRGGAGFAEDINLRRAKVAIAVGGTEGNELVGERRALVFERAAGVLRLDEAEDLLAHAGRSLNRPL